MRLGLPAAAVKSEILREWASLLPHFIHRHQILATGCGLSLLAPSPSSLYLLWSLFSEGKKIFWIFSFLFAYPSNRSLATIPGDGPLAWREISKDYQEAESVTQGPLGWLRLRWAHPMQWFIGAKLAPSQTQAMLQSPIWSHSNHYLLIFISKHSKALMFSQNESIKRTNKN